MAEEQVRPPRSEIGLTDVIAERIARFRQAKGWSQARLVAELESLGYPLDRASLSNIERGKTRADSVSVREVLVLAAALDVPPVLLFIPLGQDVDLYLTPSVSVDAHLAFRWVIGEEPFCVPDAHGNAIARHPVEWRASAVPIRMHHELMRLWKEFSHARVGPVEGAQERVDAALRAYMQHRRAMRLADLDPMWLPEDAAKRAHELGIVDDEEMSR